VPRPGGICRFGLLCALLAGCAKQPEINRPPPVPKAEADRIVAERFNADRCITNEFIPAPGSAPLPRLVPTRPLRVGLQWLFTGDAAPWLVAQRLGFFSDEGLDVKLEEGGPGRNVLVGLVMGRIDVYLGYPDSALSMITSRTGADLKIICASLKDSGVGWIGLDRTIPPNRRSTRKITAADLRGRRLGVQPEADFLFQYLCDQLGLAPSEVREMSEGATPDALITGALDYFEGLRSDQPRLLERKGYDNWTFLPLSDLGYHSYLDVSVVTADFCRREPDVLARYVAALDRSIRYIAAHPHEAAEITVASIPGDPGTVAEMEARIRREILLCLGDGSEPPLFVSPAKVRNLVSILYRYHRIDLAAPP
jgi:NitT/TauT family transport system substrate-binding protein